MGWSINILCQECNYKQRFLLGSGFDSLPQEVFYGKKPNLANFVKDKEEQIFISEIMELPDAKVQASDARLFRCLKCNQIYSKYFYCLSFGDMRHFPVFACSKCGEKPLEMLRVVEHTSENKLIISIMRNEEKVEIRCPECGSLKTAVEDGGLQWC